MSPSLTEKPEAFGRVIVESLSLGTPVVAYDHGGAAEQLEIMLPSGRIPVGDLERPPRPWQFPSHPPNHRHRAPLHPGPDATVHLGGVRRASFSDVREGTPDHLDLIRWRFMLHSEGDSP